MSFAFMIQIKILPSKDKYKFPYIVVLTILHYLEMKKLLIA